MNTIAALFIALSPVTPPTVAIDAAALTKAADARAAELADARIAGELALLADRRSEKYVSVTSPDVVRPPARFAVRGSRPVPVGG